MPRTKKIPLRISEWQIDGLLMPPSDEYIELVKRKALSMGDSLSHTHKTSLSSVALMLYLRDSDNKEPVFVPDDLKDVLGRKPELLQLCYESVIKYFEEGDVIDNVALVLTKYVKGDTHDTDEQTTTSQSDDQSTED